MTINLKIFLIYIGAFLAAWLISAIAVKSISSSFSAQGKKPWLFNIITSVLSSGAVFGATWLTENSFLLFWIFAAIFLIAGFIFVLFVHRKYFKSRKDNRNRQFAGELLFAFSIIFLCITLFSSLQYFIKKEDFLFFPTLVALIFFIFPLFLLHTFDAAYAIPDGAYNAWQYPLNTTKDIPDEDENEKIHVIGFEIAKKASDTRKTHFRAKAPDSMVLGDLFYFFINDYNDQFSETPIEYENEKEANNWYFRTKPKWYQYSKVLDPFITIHENKIKENTVIICERGNN